MNNKPFDLQKALAGEPVVTDKGHYATYRFTAVNDAIKHHHVFTYTDDKEREWVTVVNNEGLSSDTGSWITNPAALFMAPVKKTVWVNLYDWDGKIAVGKSETYESEEEAKKAAGTGTSAYLGTYPIEIEL